MLHGIGYTMKSCSSIRKGSIISSWSRRASIFFLVLILASACCWNDFSTDIGEYGGEDWSFVVVGDSRSGGGIYSNLTSWMTQIRPMPVFAMHLGDMIPFPGNEFEWENFIRLSVPLMRSMEFYCTPGNHDVDGETSQEIYQRHVSLPGNELYYSFSRDSLHFIVLDSEYPDQAKTIDDPQKTWLNNELAGVDPSYGIIVFVGLAVFSDTTHTLHNAAELHALFNSCNVLLVASGHEHRFHRITRDGICYLISGGGGSPLHSNFSGNYYHFIKISVFPGKLNVKTIGVFGETIENFDLAL